MSSSTSNECNRDIFSLVVVEVDNKLFLNVVNKLFKSTGKLYLAGVFDNIIGFVTKFVFLFIDSVSPQLNLIFKFWLSSTIIYK